MVAPGGVREVHDGARHELGDERGAHAQGSGARERLHRRHAALGDGFRSLAQEELAGRLVKLGESLHGEVLLVEVSLDHALLGLPDDVEDVGLEILGAVRADAEVEFVGIGALAEGDGDAEDGIGGGLLHAGEEGGPRGGASAHRDTVGLRVDGSGGVGAALARGPRAWDRIDEGKA